MNLKWLRVEGLGGTSKMLSLVDGVFDGVFRGVGDEEVVVGEGVVRLSSSFVRSAKSCFGGMMDNRVLSPIVRPMKLLPRAKSSSALRYIETEFPSIVFDDAFTSEVMHSYEPKPTVSYFNDLGFFKDFEKEFPAIVYNDALTSKSDFLTEPIVSPEHIDESDLKSETSLSECDEEEQNVLYFNDLFSFNVIYPDDSKLDKDND
ncbi:hypothetical protein Tco_0966796 [Tanacetum coccineum]